MFKEKIKWRDFSEAFTTFLQQMKGQADFSLAYVIRSNDDEDNYDIQPDNYDTVEAYEEAIVPFSGTQFDQDNNIVFDSLKSYVLGGPHWTWIQDFERRRDGRGAWKALKEHFEGPSNQMRLKASAYAAIKRAEYKGAKNFDYELYRRIHTQAHSDLARYGEPVPEAKKVKDFLDGITDSSLQTVKYTIAGFTHLMENFHDAANYIGNIIDVNKKNEFRHVGSIFGRAGRGRGRGHSQNKFKNNANNRNQGGRGRGRGGRAGGGRNNKNSPGRWITSDEWQSMTDEDKESIRTARANYAKRKINAISTSETEDEPSTHNDNSNNSNNRVSNPGGRGNGRNGGATAETAGDYMSRGNRSYISQLRTSQRYVGSSGPSRLIASNQSQNREGKAELDSHADTTVAGSTCRVIEFTEKSCDVFPFSESYEPLTQVPIAKVGTAFDNPTTGETYILVFGQALYLGDKLDHTLICPNQARCNGVIVDDVPRHLSHDKKSTHSLYFPDDDI
jgi:hypothetical protein